MGLFVEGNTRPDFSSADLKKLKYRCRYSQYNKDAYRFVAESLTRPATQFSMNQLNWLWKIKSSVL